MGWGSSRDIAGTYTPFAVLALPPGQGRVLLLIVCVPLLAQGGFAGDRRGGRLTLWLGAPPGSLSLALGRIGGVFVSILPLWLSSTLTIALLLLDLDGTLVNAFQDLSFLFWRRDSKMYKMIINGTATTLNSKSIPAERMRKTYLNSFPFRP